jgi:hypothetical protein
LREQDGVERSADVVGDQHGGGPSGARGASGAADGMGVAAGVTGSAVPSISMGAVGEPLRGPWLRLVMSVAASLSNR